MGYYHFQEGTYTLDGKTIAFEAVQNLYIGIDAAWGTFEELIEVEIHVAT
ncbi:hypothetical protein [Cyclobacterium jeungdonense]|uniref:Uncharacterized protein n=1 Tax=Cyclobacterium jeungdonense TaxID=708087 RepID=A0ABT8C5Z3_9BACT|nr:hypothetical protein [Cyclobacterium jeungdonense]MDN3687741.1 hypothetical protein [Cyclobacterium jeungdonense]